MKKDLEDLPQVILSKRAAQVFMNAYSVYGKSLRRIQMSTGAKPGGCPG